VPYFDPHCGETFVSDQFDHALQRFLVSRCDYRPRNYVLEHLSMQKAAENYLELYTSLA
jgi:hypothetical protein